MRKHRVAVFVVVLALGLTTISEAAEATKAHGLSVALFRSKAEVDVKGASGPISYATILGKKCPFLTQEDGAVKPAGIGTELILSLAGSVVESLVDALAMKFQAESNTLESITPIEGLFVVATFAYRDGCLVFHNGNDQDRKKRSIEAVFGMRSSTDATAFRFTVAHWKFTEFSRSETTSWGQVKGVRDIALKIEFLSPSSEGIGKRTIFVEHDFTSVDKTALASLFVPKQASPWIALPTNSDPTNASLHQPVNLRVTLVETTKPGRFARWAKQAAKDKKADISQAFQDELKKALDSGYAATETAKAAESAGTAYDAYTNAWTALTELNGKRLTNGDANDEKAWEAKVVVATRLLESKRTLAKLAFSEADLPWPGDLG